MLDMTEHRYVYLVVTVENIMRMENKLQNAVPSRKAEFTITWLMAAVFCIFLSSCESSPFTGYRQYGLEFREKCVLDDGEKLLETLGGGIIGIVDTFLVVEHRDSSPEYFWDVYNARTGDFIRSMFRHGRGPDEVLAAQYDGQCVSLDSCIFVYALDYNSEEMLRVNFTGSIYSGDDAVSVIAPLEYIHTPGFMDGDGALVYCDYDIGNGELFLAKDSESGEALRLKRIYSDVDLHDRDMAAFNTRYNAFRNKVCVAYSRLSLIQILDLDVADDNDMRLSASSDDGWRGGGTVSEETVLHYGRLNVTDRYIYAGYIGKTMEECIEDEGVFQNEIHVFSWDGEAIAKVTIIDNDVVSFAVSDDNSAMYVVNDKEEVFVYNLSNVLM